MVAVSALAVAQLQFTYQDKQRNVEIRGGSGRLTQGPGGVTKVVVQGADGRPAYAAARSQGLEMFAQKTLSVQTVPNRAQRGSSTIQSAQATGSVRTVRTVGSNNSKEVTEVLSSGADYRVNGNQGVLDLDGPVTINNSNSAQRRTLVATGRSAQAILDPTSTGPNADPLRTATLQGAVKIVVAQAASTGAEAGSTYTATGDRLVVNNASNPPTLTLTGNLNIIGSSDESGSGTVTGATRAVITLNARREMETVSLEGEPTRTVFRPKPKTRTGQR
jgi:hypothetical protein